MKYYAPASPFPLAMTIRISPSEEVDTIVAVNCDSTPVFRALQKEHNKREIDSYCTKLDKQLGLKPIEIAYPHLWGGWKRKKKNELRSR